MNFIMSLIGAAILVATGAVLGFWIEVMMAPELPNGMKSCKDCGPSFTEVEKQWKKYEHSIKNTSGEGQQKN